MPVLSPELISLILNRHNFTAAEACSMCLVSRHWRELGQAIVWRRVVIVPDNACRLDSVQAILFKNAKVSRRLGKVVKELRFSGLFMFMEPVNASESDAEYESEESDSEQEQESKPQWIPVKLVFSEMEFILAWCRRTLKCCPNLERLEFMDFHPAALRTILEAAKPAAVSLRSFEWRQPTLRSADYPRDFPPSAFLSRLATFPRLKILDIDISLPPEERFFCPSHAHEHRPLPVPSLPLVSLAISPLRVEEAEEGIDEGSTSLLLRAASKKTLREVSLVDASPSAVVKSLGEPGYNLTSLRLHYHSISAASLLEKTTALLPLHPNLLHLSIVACGRPEIDSLPRSFFQALPKGLKQLTIGIYAENGDEALGEFVMGGAGPKLESFRVKMRGGEDDSAWVWKELESMFDDLD